MSKRIEELDFRSTRIGDVSLRRRIDPVLKREVHEVLLGDEHLMSRYYACRAFNAGSGRAPVLS